MVNPFTLQSQISKVQRDLLHPLYTMYTGQEEAAHEYLLHTTGLAIAKHQPFLEELCCSLFISVIFKVVKLLGGADQLTEEDFDRFTSYVNDGGITAMIKMLLAADKEQTFVTELQRLPVQVRKNAPLMLKKSNELHNEFITGFFKENYASHHNVPAKLSDNFQKSTAFISRLTELAS